MADGTQATQTKEKKATSKKTSSTKGSSKKAPSKSKAIQEIGAHLLSALAERKAKSGSDYPAVLDSLRRDGDAVDDVVAALKCLPFKGGATFFGSPTNKKITSAEKLRCLVCLRGDEGLVLEREATYVSVIDARKQKVKSEMFSMKELFVGYSPSIAADLKSGLLAMRDAGTLREIGCLNYRGHDQFFLLSAIRGATPRTPMHEAERLNGAANDAPSTEFTHPAASAPAMSEPAVRETAAEMSPTPATENVQGKEREATDSLETFAEDFAAAFSELDQGDNWVGLLELRKRLDQYSRKAFDTGLMAVRRVRVFGLEAAEGRHRMPTEEELDSAIKEQGRTLMFVTRRG